MKAVLMLLLVVIGIAGGGALGVALRPAPLPMPEHEAGAAAAPSGAEAAAAEAAQAEPDGAPNYITFSRKFVVPVVEGSRTRALLILDLAIDAPGAAGARLQGMRPRLRDALLRVLFEFAATGAFSETYIEAPIMEELRQKLAAAVRKHSGAGLREVLILDLVRKEF